jgi:cupin fold WbuC family metalloprotein
MTKAALGIPEFMVAEGPEVYYSTRPIGQATDGVITFLKEQAKVTPRRRCRLCLHPTPAAQQQEMIIVMQGDSYVAPHKHVGKGETLLVLEGEAVAPIYVEDGALQDAIKLGPFGSGRTFFYRMPETVYHGLWITTEWLVYVETTLGPFRRDATVFPDWALDGADADRIFDERRRQLAQIEALQPR